MSERLHQAHDRFHTLEQQQDGEVYWNDNEQADKHRFCDEHERLFHSHRLSPFWIPDNLVIKSALS
jgi:hypothetical protein